MTITLRVMESSHDYNNHFVTITVDDEDIFDECLKKFNNTPLSFELEKLVTNKETIAIESRDCYGYKGELPNLDIVSKLIEYNTQKD